VFTAFFRAIFVKWLEPTARWLGRIGVTPNGITIAGTAASVAAAVTLFGWKGWWGAGCYVLWALTMLDAMDGLVARVSGRGSSFGAVLDSTCDRFADAAIFGSIGWFYALHGQKWMLLAAGLCLVLGSVTSYIRSRAEAAGFEAKVGLAERTDRLIIVLVGCGLTGAPFNLHYVQAISLWLLVGLSTITVGQRFATVYRQAQSADRAAAGAEPAGAA
jgi:CDP-diacylglycerol--glycerol-3-phosphate 3-phosphatidyltransferase